MASWTPHESWIPAARRTGDPARASGFTTTELVAALALTAVLLVALGGATHAIIDGVNDQVLELGVQQTGQTTLGALGRQFQICRPIEIITSGSKAPSFTYVVPVDVGEDGNGNGLLDAGEDANGNGVLDLTDGDFSAPDGSIQWGAVEVEGPRLDTVAAPHQITLTYQAEAKVLERDVGKDLDGDGKLGTTFLRGSLRYGTSGGRVTLYGSGKILASSTRRGADLNGDGVADPLFAIEGEPFIDADGNGLFSTGETFTDLNGNLKWDGRLRLSLWAFKSEAGRLSVVRNYTRTWRFQGD